MAPFFGTISVGFQSGFSSKRQANLGVKRIGAAAPGTSCRADTAESPLRWAASQAIESSAIGSDGVFLLSIVDSDYDATT
jgi:hypothetical protein